MGVSGSGKSTITAMHKHFMPASLLDRQFATLQEPGEDENPITAPIDAQPHEIVQEIIAKLRIATILV
jgi:gluconokinase